VLSDEVMGKRARSVCSFRSSSSDRRRPWSRGRNEDEDEEEAKAVAAAAESERIAMVDLRRSPIHRPRKPR